MTEETLFHEALAQPPAERATFLDAACAGQPELRAAVAALLAAREASDGFLNRPPEHPGETVESHPIPADQDAAGEVAPSPLAAALHGPATAEFPGKLDTSAPIAGRYTLQERIGASA